MASCEREIWWTSAMPSSTSTFTAPYDGVYKLSSVVLSASTLGVTPKLYKNGAATNVIGFSTGESDEQSIISAVLSLTQGDEITIVNQSADDDISSFANGYHTHFEGFLLTRT